MDCFAALAMTWMARFHPPLSSSAKAGDPVRRGFSVLSSASLESWVARSSRAMTTECVFAFSRRNAPELCIYLPPPKKSEGAGNAGCALHPRSCAQRAQKVRAQAYRAAESIRHSLRNGFTAYFELSPVIGSFATVIPEKLASQELDASTEASGPHDFTVRGRLRPKDFDRLSTSPPKFSKGGLSIVRLACCRVHRPPSH